MHANRRQNSSVTSLVDVQARDKVNAIRESLIELKKLTAEERELSTLGYLIEMALQEASTPQKV